MQTNIIIPTLTTTTVPLIMIKIKVTKSGGKVGLSRSSEINAKPKTIVNMIANKLLKEPQSS